MKCNHYSVLLNYGQRAVTVNKQVTDWSRLYFCILCECYYFRSMSRAIVSIPYMGI